MRRHIGFYEPAAKFVIPSRKTRIVTKSRSRFSRLCVPARRCQGRFLNNDLKALLNKYGAHWRYATACWHKVNVTTSLCIGCWRPISIFVTYILLGIAISVMRLSNCDPLRRFKLHEKKTWLQKKMQFSCILSYSRILSYLKNCYLHLNSKCFI